jgi:hypothetical protein
LTATDAALAEFLGGQGGLRDTADAVSAITPSTGNPLAWRTEDAMRRATFFAAGTARGRTAPSTPKWVG